MSDQGVEIKISTVAELTALRELEQELQKAVVAARAFGNTALAGQKEEELKAIQAQLSQFTTGDKLQAELKGFVDKIPLVGEGVRALNGAFGVFAKGALVAAGALQVAKQAVEAFAEKETEVARLNQALANSGQYSAAASLQVQELAGQFEKLTGLDDGKFINVARTLLQFGAKRENLEKYTQGVVDLAGVMGGDVEQAAFLFAKAMQGSTEMLTRYGIQIDTNRSQLEQLDQLMQQAAQRGGGQLTATQGTLRRGFTDLTHATGDWFVGVGSLIAQTGILQRSLHILAEMVRFFSFSDAVKPAKDFQNSLEGVGESAEQVATKLEAAKTAGTALAQLTLETLATSAEDTRAEFEALTATIQATEQAELALSQAQTALDLAQIDEDQNTGKIGAGEAAERRYRARNAGTEREALAKLAALQGTIAAEEAKVEQAGLNTQAVTINLNSEKDTLAKQEAAAAARQAELAANTERRQAQQLAQNQALAAAQLEVEATQDKITLPGTPGRAKQEAATQALATAAADSEAATRAFAEAQAPLRAELATTNEAITAQKELVAALAEELKKTQAEEATVQRAASVKIPALEQQSQTTAEVYNLKQQAGALAQKAVLRAADKEDAAAAEANAAAAIRELIGADTANTATRFANQLAASPAAKDKPEVRAAAEALAKAAAAAREGDTTESESEALLAALIEVRTVLADNHRFSKSLSAEIATLRTQIASQRTR
jgi:hypothetical protein